MMNIINIYIIIASGSPTTHSLYSEGRIINFIYYIMKL